MHIHTQIVIHTHTHSYIIGHKIWVSVIHTIVQNADHYPFTSEAIGPRHLDVHVEEPLPSTLPMVLLQSGKVSTFQYLRSLQSPALHSEIPCQTHLILSTSRQTATLSNTFAEERNHACIISVINVCLPVSQSIM